MGEKKPEAVKEDTPENEGGEGEGEDEKDDKKGKKGKKSKKEKEEEEAKKKKKPNKAILAAMAETLAKQKEEEERLKAEEEEKERLEKEREKQKKEQLKAEGKWLTPAQKAAKARADAMLEAMRAQGAEVPVAGEKKLTMKERAKLKKQNKSKHVEQAAASKETTPV